MSIRVIPLVTLVTLSATLLAVGRAEQPGSKPAVRIGTYDTRAVAVAYAASSHMKETLAGLMKARDAARAAGNTAEVKAIEAKGEALQRKLHRQGISNMPVDDLLEPVSDRLASVAKEAGVVAIVPRVNCASAEVEVVDVTDRIVALYEPTQRTLKMVASVRETQPMDLDAVEKSHQH